MRNFNKTRYATRHEVVTTIEVWAARVLPEYTLSDVAIHGESITHFAVRFRDPRDGTTIEVTLGIFPDQGFAPGWHVVDTRLEWVGRERGERSGVVVYPAELETLMIVYPTHRLTHIDNEDEEFPVFGYGALDDDNFFQAFIQHSPNPDDDTEYWKNDQLPYSTIITERLVMNRIDLDMHDYLDVNLNQLDEY